MSVDHKPEDEPEKTRIERAGGKITGDGRINGGLNLSRAIGKNFLVLIRNSYIPCELFTLRHSYCSKDKFKGYISSKSLELSTFKN